MPTFFFINRLRNLSDLYWTEYVHTTNACACITFYTLVFVYYWRHFFTCSLSSIIVRLVPLTPFSNKFIIFLTHSNQLIIFQRIRKCKV